jgi:hypothetical protein
MMRGPFFEGSEARYFITGRYGGDHFLGGRTKSRDRAIARRASFIHFNYRRATEEETRERRVNKDNEHEQNKEIPSDLDCQFFERPAQPFVPDGMSATDAAAFGAKALYNPTATVQAIDISPLRARLLSRSSFLSARLPPLASLSFLFNFEFKNEDAPSPVSNLDIICPHFRFSQFLASDFEFLFDGGLFGEEVFCDFFELLLALEFPARQQVEWRKW